VNLVFLLVCRCRGPSDDGPEDSPTRRTESNGPDGVQFQPGPGKPLLRQVVQGRARILSLRAQGTTRRSRIRPRRRLRRRMYFLRALSFIMVPTINPCCPTPPDVSCLPAKGKYEHKERAIRLTRRTLLCFLYTPCFPNFFTLSLSLSLSLSPTFFISLSFIYVCVCVCVCVCVYT
jgi:hypothetical protein